jgi:acyl-coenzyme A synthetase/AMP-(fatty) acid ligase
VGIGTIGAQEVVAAVLLKPNIAATPAIEREILDAARSALAASEVPKRIVFVPDLPTVLGGAKVQREVLQQRLAAAT